jgi:Ig-like domain CHU_C associated
VKTAVRVAAGIALFIALSVSAQPVSAGTPEHDYGLGFVVLLDVPADKVPAVAAELAARHKGTLVRVWQHALKGFWVHSSLRDARALAADPRVVSVEANVEVSESASQNSTDRPYPVATLPLNLPPDLDDEPFWHLRRLGQRQQAPAEKRYMWIPGVNDGSGVRIYVVDSGMITQHQEFYTDQASAVIAAPDGDTDANHRSAQVTRILKLDCAARSRWSDACVWTGLGPPPPEATPAWLSCTDSNGPWMRREDTRIHHGTGVASIAAGRNTGVAKNAYIVPVKTTAQCNLFISSAAMLADAFDWIRRTHPSGQPGVVSISTFRFLASNCIDENEPNRTTSCDTPFGEAIDCGPACDRRPLPPDYCEVPPEVPQQCLSINPRQRLTTTPIPGQFSALEEAVAAVVRSGIPVVASANNQGSPSAAGWSVVGGNACLTTPARLSRGGEHSKGVITVGGLSRTADTRWSDSNYGQCVDIWAPAEELLIARPTYATDYVQLPAAGEASIVSGTSFSAPMVAGIIARFMSEDRSLWSTPLLTANRVWDRLRSTATIPAAQIDPPRTSLIAYAGGVTIYEHPTTQVVRAGDLARFRVSAVVPGWPWQLRYRLYRGPLGDVSSSTLKVESASPAMSFTAAAGDDGTYWVRVHAFTGTEPTGDLYGDSRAAQLTVSATAPSCTTPTPRITGAQSVSRHQTTTLTAVVDGVPPAELSYEWSRRITDTISASIGVGEAIAVSGVNSIDSYTVRVTRNCGGTPVVVTSAPFPVTCSDCPIIRRRAVTANGVPTSLVVAGVGESVVLSVPEQAPAYTYAWYRGTNRDTSSQTAIGTSASVVVQAAASEETYWVRTFDNTAPATPVPDDSDFVTVVGGPASTLTVTADPGLVVATNDLLRLTADWPGLEPGAEVEWEWHEGRTMTANDPVAGTERVLALANLPDDVSYWVRARRAGETAWVSSSLVGVIVTCSPQPNVAIAIHPISAAIGNDVAAIAPDTIATLSAVTPGKRVTYNWFSGSGSERVMVGFGQALRVQPSTAQVYTVEAYDACGNMSSKSVTVRVCVPKITSEPQDVTIAPNATTTLSVGVQGQAGGNTDLSYQWYAGHAPQTGNTAGTGSTLQVGHAQSGTYPYWVAVRGSCNNPADVHVVSRTATVTVCAYPTIGPHTAERRIRSGETTTLSVTAGGTALTYQWFEIVPGGSPRALAPPSAASSVGVSPQGNTSYFARVFSRGVCTADTPAIPVFVCSDPVITTQPSTATATVVPNTTATISIGATGHDSIEWYGGDPGDTTSGILGTGTQFQTPPVAQARNFWARVRSAHCSVDSAAVSIGVCTIPAVTWNAAQTAVASNQSQVISVSASPVAGTTYTWYRGPAGNVSASTVISGPTLNAGIAIAPAETTSYWVRAHNQMCSADTPALTINVVVPTIGEHPQPITIVANTTTRLSVTATAAAQYRWYIGDKGVTSLPVNPGNTREIDVTPAETTKYWCRVTGATGVTADSNAAVVSVCPALAIDSVTRPSIHRGNSTTLSTSTRGLGVTYKWYQGPLGGGTQIATTPTVGVTPQTTTDYWVRATDACGRTADAATKVSVYPIIDAHPAGSRITDNTAATFQVVADATPVSYKWFRSGDPTVLGTAASYTTPALTADATYFVRVTSGDASVDSNPATATICRAPVITTANNTQTSGAPVTLSVQNPVAGDTYLWYDGGTPIANTGAVSSLTVYPAQSTAYWVRATSATCHADSAQYLVIVCYPRVVTPPQNASIVEGQSTTLSVAATGTPTLYYQWFTGPSGNMTAPVAGATSASLPIAPVTTTSYWARITSSAGAGCAVNSAAATVSVCNVPRITTQPAHSWISNPGLTGSLSVTATGPSLTYQWYIGTTGDVSRPLSGKTAATLSHTLHATERFWVRVSNGCGIADSSWAYISVKPPFLEQPQSASVNPGSTAMLQVTMSGAYLSYQWYRSDGVAVGTSSPSFITPSLTAQTSYYCVVTSGTVQVTSSWATIGMCAGPAIPIQPYAEAAGSCRSLAINYGYDNEYVTYRWYRGQRGDTTSYAGTGARITVCPAGTATYWCRATDNETGCTTDSQTINVP